jgi:hypothetical protein
MDKVRKPSNSVCYTPSSEPYRIYCSYLAKYSQYRKMLEVTFLKVNKFYIVRPNNLFCGKPFVVKQ